MGESPSVSVENRESRGWETGGGGPRVTSGSWQRFRAKGVIVCVITQGITLDTVRPLGVCVCVGRRRK